jgi:hypothetical protein
LATVAAVTVVGHGTGQDHHDKLKTILDVHAYLIQLGEIPAAEKSHSFKSKWVKAQLLESTGAVAASDQEFEGPSNFLASNLDEVLLESVPKT